MVRSHTTKPRRTPRQERSRALVDAILEATAQTLRIHGLEKTTTARIAERAGVSVGSFYQYFPNKPALYRALAERFFSRLDAASDMVWPQIAAAPLRQGIRLAVRGIIAVGFVDPVLDRILHQVAVSRAGLPAVAAFEARQEGIVAELLRARRAELPDPDLEPDLAARITMRAVGGIVGSTLARDPDLARDPRFADELVRLVERYLGYADGGAVSGMNVAAEDQPEPLDGHRRASPPDSVPGLS